LLIISLKLIVIDAMELALLDAIILLAVGSMSALKHPGCQSVKPQSIGESLLLCD